MSLSNRFNQLLNQKVTRADNMLLYLKLLECQVLSWRYVRNHAELVTVVEEFCQEDDDKLRRSGCKLLCGRLKTMVRSSIVSSTDNSLYTNILPFSGKEGYELMRFD
jgi:hypothetical protein